MPEEGVPYLAMGLDPSLGEGLHGGGDSTAGLVAGFWRYQQACLAHRLTFSEMKDPYIALRQ
jgi:hypothetical protein